MLLASALPPEPAHQPRRRSQISAVYYGLCVCSGLHLKRGEKYPASLHKFPSSTSTVPFNISSCVWGKRRREDKKRGGWQLKALCCQSVIQCEQNGNEAELLLTDALNISLQLVSTHAGSRAAETLQEPGRHSISSHWANYEDFTLQSSDLNGYMTLLLKCFCNELELTLLTRQPRTRVPPLVSQGHSLLELLKVNCDTSRHHRLQTVASVGRKTMAQVSERPWSHWEVYLEPPSWEDGLKLTLFKLKRKVDCVL